MGVNDNDFGWYRVQIAKKISQTAWAPCEQAFHPVPEVPDGVQAVKPVAPPSAQVASMKTDLVSNIVDSSRAAETAESKELANDAASSPEPMPSMQPRNQTSPKKIKANRQNAKKSTGPKTEGGKKLSSLNAIKHGFLSQAIVIKDRRGGESQEEFDQLHAEVRNYFEPCDYLEDMCVELMAISLWKRRRGFRCENATISNQYRCNRILSKGIVADLQRSFETDDGKKQRELEGPASDDSLCIPTNPDRFLRYEAFLEKQFNTAYQRLRELQERRRHPSSRSSTLKR